MQWRRVREVGKQSLLYVGAYFCCNICPIAIQVLDNRNYEYNKNAVYAFLPLLIGQSILTPLMGFFNCIIYFRPTFGRVRKKFPTESKIWCVKKTMFGQSINNSASTRAIPFSRPNWALRVDFAGDIQVSALHSLEDSSSVVERDNNLTFHANETETTNVDQQSESKGEDHIVNAEETTSQKDGT